MTISRVDMVSPNMRENPRPAQNSSVRARGRIPTMVVMLVIMMGCRRAADDSMRAAFVDRPCAFTVFIRSMMMIESLITTPDKATIPRKAGKDKFRPMSMRPGNTPIKASGIAKRMINGCFRELKMRTRVAAINMIPIIIDLNRSRNDSATASLSPPNSIRYPLGRL